MDRKRARTLRDQLAAFPRAVLVPRPTPLDELPHLGRELGVEFWLKRDDLTPIALGGDKPRKLEFELGRALAEGADTIVTVGASQSNHARLTTAASRRVGLDVAVVLSRDDYTAVQGNLLAVGLMGARITVSESDNHWYLDEDIARIVEELRAEGRRPYFIPVSGTTPLSCLGYVAATLELLDQFDEAGVSPSVMYLPFGSGGIFSATLLALRFLGVDTPVVGVGVNARREQCEEFLDTWWDGITRLLEVEVERGHYEITDRFIGRKYGDPTPATLDAISLMATTEGILLDPVYSGKVFAAVVDRVRSGEIAAGESVAMLHSGGTPALFAYHETLRDHLARRGDLVDLPRPAEEAS